jgi:hypothetical protein
LSGLSLGEGSWLFIVSIPYIWRELAFCIIVLEKKVKKVINKPGSIELLVKRARRSGLGSG